MKLFPPTILLLSTWVGHDHHRALTVLSSRAVRSDGLAFEQKQFIELITGDDAAGMRYGFLSQRLAAHIPGIRVDDALAVDRVGVIGGGLMGSGIAMAF